MLFSLTVNAQTYKLYQTGNIHNQLKLNTKTGEVKQVQDDGQTFLVNEAVTPNSNNENRYILHKTENIWTFILLDKYTGKLWQCQYSAENIKYILSVEINSIELSNTQSNKFSIQPMTSMYQFYLVDDETGEMWQFQWNKDKEYRWIKKL